MEDLLFFCHLKNYSSEFYVIRISGKFSFTLITGPFAKGEDTKANVRE